MDVLVIDVRFVHEILHDVTQEDFNRWCANKLIVHGDVVRPLCNVLRLETNYVATPATVQP